MRQQVIATLGRLEDLRGSGQLERLLRSGARFADKAIVCGRRCGRRGDDRPGATGRGGPGRLWEETGCRAVARADIASPCQSANRASDAIALRTRA